MADFPLGLDDLERMGQARLGLYRARFREDQVLVDGSYSDWARLDNLAREAAMSGVALQPVLINMPLEVYTPPKTDAERIRFGEFAAAAVLRYGPDGSFWAGAAVPGCQRTVWEVWNEPNIAPFWDLPNPAEYGALLVETGSAIRAADPDAGDVRRLYPVDAQRHELEPAFLRDVIAAVGADQFDALALHSYRPNAERAVDTLIAGTVETLKTYAGVTADGAPGSRSGSTSSADPPCPDDPTTPKTSRQPPRNPADLARYLSRPAARTPLRLEFGASDVVLASRRPCARPPPGSDRTAPHQHRRHRRRAKALLGRLHRAQHRGGTALSARLHDLTVEKAGDGVGTVTSPAGIDCGVACSGSYTPARS